MLDFWPLKFYLSLRPLAKAGGLFSLGEAFEIPFQRTTMPFLACLKNESGREEQLGRGEVSILTIQDSKAALDIANDHTNFDC